MTPHEAWRVWRDSSVVGEQGDLALIAMHDIREPSRVDGVPGLWAPTAPDKPGLTLTAAPADGLLLAQDRPALGAVELHPDLTVVRIAGTTRYVTATYQPGSDHLRAVWDAEAAAVRAFERIDAYAYDPAWALNATFLPDTEANANAEAGVNSDTDGKDGTSEPSEPNEPRESNEPSGTFRFAHTGDATGRLREHRSPGVIRFVRDGEEYRLRPFASGDSLIVVFGDRTNGAETYGMGRMLLVEAGADDAVRLDFNRAFLPPCAFSPYFNCPMPPAGNRLPFAIRAGEKRVESREA